MLGFVHVPKTGGTYIKNLLTSNNIEFIYEGHRVVYTKNDKAIYFGFVRNPWTHLLSFYHHTIDGNCVGFCYIRQQFPTFQQLIKSRLFFNKYEQIYENDQVKVDIIFKTEYITDAIPILEDIIGKKLICHDIEQNKNENKPTIDIYDEEMDTLIQDGYKTELDKFHYDKQGNTSDVKMFFYNREGEPISKKDFYHLHNLKISS